MEWGFSSFIVVVLAFLLGLIFGAASQVKRMGEQSKRQVELNQLAVKFIEAMAFHKIVGERIEIMRLVNCDEAKYEKISRQVGLRLGAQ